jgi:hypothetical protein
MLGKGKSVIYDSIARKAKLLNNINPLLQCAKASTIAALSYLTLAG